MKKINKIIVILGLVTALPAHAATLIWTNTAGGNWNTAANWSPNTAPGAADTAVITNAGTYTVNGTGATIAGLAVGGGTGTQTLSLNSGTFTLNGAGTVAPSGQLKLAGGALSGTNLVTVAGLLTWTAGAINASAAAAITAGGQGTMSFGSVPHLYGALTNAGNLTFGGTQGFYLDGVLHNAPGGVFDLQSSETIYKSGTGVLVNAGTVRKSVVTGTSTINAPVSNSGTFDAQVGVIALTGGGTLSAGSDFIGAGGTNQCSGGTVTFNGTVHSTNLRLTGAMLAGTGTLTGSAWWTAGDINVGAALTVEASSQLTVSFGAVPHLYGVLTNAGTLTFGGTQGFYLDGVLHNAPGGVFDLRNSETIFKAGSGFFVNAGTVRKSAGIGTSWFSAPVFNSGTFDAQVGVISLAGGGTFSTGSDFTGAGTNQWSGGNATFDGTVHSTNLRLAGAALAGTGTLTGTAWWTAGNINLGGALTVGAGGQLDISFGAVQHLYGALTNAGTIVFLGPQGFYQDGLIHNLPGGLFDLQSSENIYNAAGAGPFINQGTVRKSFVGGTSTFSQPVVNSGAFEALSGVIALEGQTTLNTGSDFTGAGTNQCSGGTVTFNGTVHSTNLRLAGAAITGAGTLTGTAWWTAGHINLGGALTVGASSQLTVSLGAVQHLYGALTNAGTIVFLGPQGFYQDGLIHNLPGGLFDLQSSENIYDTVGAGPFINQGTVRKAFVGGTSTFNQPVVNSGTFEAVSGVIALTGQTTLSTGSVFTGAGTNQCSGGTVTFNGTVHSTNLRLAGSAITDTGTLTGTAWWTAGNINLGGALTVGAGSQLTINQGAVQHLYGVLTNAGTIVFLGPQGFYLDGLIHNLPGGLFDLQSSESIYGAGNSGQFLNAGVLRKTVVGGTSIVSAPLVNSGTVLVEIGTLRFPGTYTHAAGTIQLAGATFVSTKPVYLNGGRLAGWGLCDAIVTNAATVSPAGTGVLTISGNYIQTLEGNLEIELGGLIAGTNHSRLDVTGTARPHGSVSVRRVPGYVPNPGDSFVVLTAPVVYGTFRCFNGFFFLGHDRRLLIDYHPTDVTLITVTAPDPPAFEFISKDNQVIVCWPWEFPGFSLFSNTNLNQTNWSMITGIGNNRYLEFPAEPKKFFQLIKLARVWEDINGNGIQDEPASTGMNGVTVNLLDCGGNLLKTTSTTNDSSSQPGHYLFYGLRTGCFQMQFVAPEGYQFSLKHAPGSTPENDSDADPDTGRTVTINLPGDTRNVTWDAGLYRPGGLANLVWEDLNGNGIQDEPASAGLNGVTVRLLDCNGSLISTTTTTNNLQSQPGYYSFTGQTQGCYQVQFVAPPGYQLTTRNAPGSNAGNDSDADPVTGKTMAINLPYSSTNLTVAAGLYRPACIGDRVWADTNRNGLQDDGATGIGAVSVSLYRCGDPNLVTSTNTALDGSYQFCGLMPGTYYLVFGKPSGYAYSQPNQGTDRCADSDADTAGTTVCVPLVSGQTDNCWDAGLYQP